MLNGFPKDNLDIAGICCLGCIVYLLLVIVTMGDDR